MDGNKLVAARKRLCWTQEQAAEELQVGLTTIHRWEKGEVTPRGDSLRLISEKYGLTPVDLGIAEETGVSRTLAFPAEEHLHPLAAFAEEDLFTCLWSLTFQPYRGYQPLQEAMSLPAKGPRNHAYRPTESPHQTPRGTATPGAVSLASGAAHDAAICKRA